MNIINTKNSLNFQTQLQTATVEIIVQAETEGEALRKSQSDFSFQFKQLKIMTSLQDKRNSIATFSGIKVASFGQTLEVLHLIGAKKTHDRIALIFSKLLQEALNSLPYELVTMTEKYLNPDCPYSDFQLRLLAAIQDVGERLAYWHWHLQMTGAGPFTLMNGTRMNLQNEKNALVKILQHGLKEDDFSKIQKTNIDIPAGTVYPASAPAEVAKFEKENEERLEALQQELTSHKLTLMVHNLELGQ